MSRILLLILFLLWLVADQLPGGPSVAFGRAQLAIFFGGFVVLVLLMAGWSRLLAQRVTGGNIGRSLQRFNRGMFLARTLIPAWFAVGIFVLGWYDAVVWLLPMLRGWETPLISIGLLPPLIAWMALWWAQFPADRALREQSMLIQLNDDLPLRAPPTFASYFAANLRLQMLFTVVPILLILLGHDVAVAVWKTALGVGPSETAEAAINLLSAAAVFAFAPQILRYVLDTVPLPDSPLRNRLREMCRRHGLRYRDILLWRTRSSMGNAAVVGIIPHLRYILMSDLLLETMSDEQIEAVFAHEMGHIVHRHMIWYVIFFAILLLALAGPGDWIGMRVDAMVRALFSGAWAPEVAALILLALALAGFLILFGYISRRFERQADVFAARNLESSQPPASISRPVGPRGAALFASALHRVAIINNIPIATRSWCHGSIARRMNYLLELSHDPDGTGRFDRYMGRLYGVLLLALVLCGGYLLFV